MKTKIYLGASEPKRNSKSKIVEQWDDFVKTCKNSKKSIYKKPKYKNIFEKEEETFGEFE